MTTVTKSRNSKMYEKLIAHFRKQYGSSQVFCINKVFVDEDNKVFGGEWLDYASNLHLTSGWVLDCVKIIEFSK